jgi:thiamine kinase-like enzyme
MRYYYFDPIKKQYYFPKNYRAYPLMHSFYQPYTLQGWILWKLWNRLSWFRSKFVVKEIDTILPILNLQPYLPKHYVAAYNRGTVGVEQKITVLGVDTETSEAFFIKYAETEIARNNVNNEGAILKQLKQLDFVPQIQHHINTESFTFIQTCVLKGERIRKLKTDSLLLDVLFKIAKQKVDTTRNYKSGVQQCFAHGDFCPWNMMLDNQQLMVFDWEMAGMYPLGYDLFTYLFQSSFLLKPRNSISSVFAQNKLLITAYFEHFRIKVWKESLIEFSNLKLQFETDKQNVKLVSSYQKLKLYAEKL